MPFRSSRSGLLASLTAGHFLLVMQKWHSNIPVGRHNHTDTLSTPNLYLWPQKTPKHAFQTGGPNSGTLWPHWDHWLTKSRDVLNATISMNRPFIRSSGGNSELGEGGRGAIFCCRTKLCLRLDQAFSFTYKIREYMSELKFWSLRRPWDIGNPGACSPYGKKWLAQSLAARLTEVSKELVLGFWHGKAGTAPFLHPLPLLPHQLLSFLNRKNKQTQPFYPLCMHVTLGKAIPVGTRRPSVAVTLLTTEDGQERTTAQKFNLARHTWDQMLVQPVPAALGPS